MRESPSIIQQASQELTKRTRPLLQPIPRFTESNTLAGHQPSGPKLRRKHLGANLAILCAMAIMIIAFMGISIYTGLQAFIEGDLQRASMNAAMAGAAAYYGTADGTGRPTPDAGGAQGLATSTFNAIVSNSSLNGFGGTATVTSNDSNDSITVTGTASIPTAFLAPIGINSIETTTKATARALRYEPTQFTGPLRILPVAGNIGSYSRNIKLAFPLVDGPGNDLYIEQDPASQQGYVVEACNDTECYNLVPGATKVGTSQILTVNGMQVIYGTAIIDMNRAGVRKANKIRITHCNQFDFYNAGAGPTPTPTGTPLIIKRMMLFGYASACVDDKTCTVPAGFAPVQ